MKYTDLTNEELESLLEMSIALNEGRVSIQFFKCFMNLLAYAVKVRKQA